MLLSVEHPQDSLTRQHHHTVQFGYRYLSLGHRYLSFGHRSQSFGHRYLLFGLRRSARAVHTVQLFGRLAVVETHTLWYFGHHCCLVVGFDALGIWHFWMFTLFHPFLPFCTQFLPISTTSTLFLG